MLDSEAGVLDMTRAALKRFDPHSEFELHLVDPTKPELRLAMSTVDVVSQVGGSPANFLDIGGGSNATVMAGALEVINNDPNVRSIFINIFGGITKGEEVANGIVAALGRVDIDQPIVIRLDGTNADLGREILQPHLSDKLQMQPTMVDAARTAVALAGK